MAHVVVVVQEYVKAVIQARSPSDINVCQNIMFACIDAGLRLLSPFMPFITEELYQRLPTQNNALSIGVAPYPQPCDVCRTVFICNNNNNPVHIYSAVIMARDECRLSANQLQTIRPSQCHHLHPPSLFIIIT